MGPLDPPGGASTSVDVLFNNMSTGSTDSSGYPLDIVDPVEPLYTVDPVEPLYIVDPVEPLYIIVDPLDPLGWMHYIQWIHLSGFTGSTESSASIGLI